MWTLVRSIVRDTELGLNTLFKRSPADLFSIVPRVLWHSVLSIVSKWRSIVYEFGCKSSSFLRIHGLYEFGCGSSSFLESVGISNLAIDDGSRIDRAAWILEQHQDCFWQSQQEEDAVSRAMTIGLEDAFGNTGRWPDVHRRAISPFFTPALSSF